MIITISIILAIVIAAIGIGTYVLSFRTATFDIIPENLGVTVRDLDNQEKGSLDQDGSLQLQDGTYTATPNGESYSAVPIEFKIDGQDITVTVDPDFSESRLEELRKSEQPAITQVIQSTYSSAIGDFTIQPGTLYNRGEWYGGLLVQKPLGGGQLGDTYRVILKKENNKWIIAAEPKIVLSASDYPDIPRDILTNVNAKEQ